jgi:hypothetical protein
MVSAQKKRPFTYTRLHSIKFNKLTFYLLTVVVFEDEPDMEKYRRSIREIFSFKFRVYISILMPQLYATHAPSKPNTFS